MKKNSHAKPNGVNGVNTHLSRSVIKITPVMQATSQSFGSKLQCIACYEHTCSSPFSKVWN